MDVGDEGDRYLIVVQAPCTVLPQGGFATESAFAAHLRALKKELGPRFSRIQIAAPTHGVGAYESNKHHLVEIDSEDEGFEFLPMFPGEMKAARFWFGRARSAWRDLGDLVRQSKVVHSGLSTDIWRPICFMAILQAVRQRKASIFVVDIDFRRDAWMNYATRHWSLKSYLLCRMVYDRLRMIQIWYAVRRCSLCLLKGRSLVKDFGKGRSNVRDFYDAPHSADQVIGNGQLEQKLARMRNPSRPLRMIYFGQLVWRKGVDRAIRAFHEARRSSGRDFKLEIIGDGDRGPELKALVTSLGESDNVVFHDTVRYGPLLFEKLYTADLTLATPLSEDTPRSAFDSLASGCPIIGFDLYYYRDLEVSGAVVTTPWPEVEPLAEKIIEMDRNRARLGAMASAGVNFARVNTQEVWLERRVEWTFPELKTENAAGS